MVLTAIKVKPEAFKTVQELKTYVGVKLTPDCTAKLEHLPVISFKKKHFLNLHWLMVIETGTKPFQSCTFTVTETSGGSSRSDSDVDGSV